LATEGFLRIFACSTASKDLSAVVADGFERPPITAGAGAAESGVGILLFRGDKVPAEEASTDSLGRASVAERAFREDGIA
jgi:hypothetical protein